MTRPLTMDHVDLFFRTWSVDDVVIASRDRDEKGYGIKGTEVSYKEALEFLASDESLKRLTELDELSKKVFSRMPEYIVPMILMEAKGHARGATDNAQIMAGISKWTNDKAPPSDLDFSKTLMEQLGMTDDASHNK